MKRRAFIKQTSLAAAATSIQPGKSLALPPINDNGAQNPYEPSPAISFDTSDPEYQSRYQDALDLLASNTQTLASFAKPVLIEGSSYQGIWLECAPHEGLVYSAIHPDIARNNHEAFFRLQREEGWMPCSLKNSGAGFGQIQMVVPIAATAWELAQQTNDDQLLADAYAACTRWDQWLLRYRNARGTGLCEGFCTYDTGHDNSPRWAGIPNRCPDADARKCPAIPSLPRLCPDLSATVYGGRIALAAMAEAIGKRNEADRWIEAAGAIRGKIVGQLYDERDAAFYDRDAQDQFVRIRGDAITRVLSERVVDQKLFDVVYDKQIRNPKAFWAPFPLPSIALDDPAFVRPMSRNSWGGASQALTALRAPRWMEHYGKPADLSHMMQQWITALLAARAFLQQMDPISGAFSKDAPGYSPAALVFLDFTWRLHGVRSAEEQIEWNIRPRKDRYSADFRLRISPLMVAELKYKSGVAHLRLNDRPLLKATGTVRLITRHDGTLIEAIGTSDQRGTIVIQRHGRHDKSFVIEPDQRLKLAI